MKKLFKTFVLAGVLAVATTSGAFAGGNHQAMAQRNWEYFNQKKVESGKASGVQQVSDTLAAPKASEYPCANCVYDQQQGGYVQKNYGKR